MSPKKKERGPRTFVVSPGRALVGAMLGNDFSNHTAEELEAMVQHMEGRLAEAEKEEQEAPGDHGAKEQGAAGPGNGSPKQG